MRKKSVWKIDIKWDNKGSHDELQNQNKAENIN